MNEWFQWHSWSWCVCDIVDGCVTILLAVGFNGTAPDNMSDIVDDCVAIFTSGLSVSIALLLTLLMVVLPFLQAHYRHQKEEMQG